MYLVILKGMPCDLLNHVHDIGSKTTTLEGPLSHTHDLRPNKVKHTEWLSIRCHPMEQVSRIICNVALVSTLAVNSLPEHPV